jgi:hypothetical protein
MVRLLSMLLMLVLVALNGAGVATAICQHGDAQAHVAARHSMNRQIAAAAIVEETASKAQQDGSLADAAAVQLAGFLKPSEPVISLPADQEPSTRLLPKTAELANRAIPPPLEPPLA